jgi:DNA-binding SARP family transcriptional activator
MPKDSGLLLRATPHVEADASEATPIEDERTLDEAADQRSLVLLRAFDLAGGGNSIGLPTRAQRLVALLAVTHRALSRSTVAARLWPDVVNAKANASLRATLWSLARYPPSLVVVEGGMLVLDPDIRLDLDEAYKVAESILDGTYSCENGCSEAMLSEDLLPAWTDEWLAIERERFRQTRLHALDELCVLHARAGRFARAIAAGLASVSSEPTRESAHRALMTAHLLEGNRMEAIRQYHTYLSIAKAEMGIGPSDRLQDLFLSALRDAPSDEAMTPR